MEQYEPDSSPGGEKCGFNLGFYHFYQRFLIITRHAWLASPSLPEELQSSDSLESLFQIITTVRGCEDGGGGNGGSLSVSPDNTGYPSCLKRKSSEHTKATKRKARTCFSAHISTVISTSSTNSGWWTPAELKAFRDRVWQDATLSTHLRRKRANSVEAEYAYDDCCNGDGDLWLEEGASAPQSNPQQPPNPQRFRPSPSHPPFLELTSEAEKVRGEEERGREIVVCSADEIAQHGSLMVYDVRF